MKERVSLFRLFSAFCIFFIILLFKISSVNYVYAATQVEGELSTPSKLRWKEGSTATAAWSAVNEANYYIVNVHVSNNGISIGDRETGTGSTEIDLQQEIHAIVGNAQINKVQVSFDVQAKKIMFENDTYILGNKSQVSSAIDYAIRHNEKLGTPSNLRLNANNYHATWNYDNNGDTHWVELKLSCGSSEVTTGSGWTAIDSTRYEDEGSYDLSELIRGFYGGEKLWGKEVQVSFRVYSTANPFEKDYDMSDVSNWSNSIPFCIENTPVKLETPYNLRLDPNNYYATWCFDENGDTQWVEIKLSYDSTDYTTGRGWTAIDSVSYKDQGFYDLSGFIRGLYGGERLWGKTVKVSFRVYSNKYLSEVGFDESDTSDWSNEVTYYVKDAPPKLKTPFNLKLDPDNYHATWSFDENGDTQWVELRLSYGGSEETTGRGWTAIDTISYKNEGFYDLSGLIRGLYNGSSLNPGPSFVSFRVYSNTNLDNYNYEGSDTSAWSNEVLYNPNNYPIVEQIKLSPEKPLVAVGDTIYLGKTILPENAYYKTIKWTSSNNAIASTDENGMITGVSFGQTGITAKIGRAVSTVSVNVYEIKSNIEDEESNQEAIDEANDIIQNIIVDGNTENTDIADVEEAKDEIEKGSVSENGFNVDLTVDEKAEEEFEQYSDKIDDKLGGFNYGCGFDIKIGIGYYDKFGFPRSVGNITHFNKKLKFTISPYGLPKEKEGCKREFILIRIHDGVVERIPVSVRNDGLIEVLSEDFSDFILGYKDEDGSDNKTEADNLPMDYYEEDKGDYKAAYNHAIPFFGKAKPSLKMFGDITIKYNEKIYTAVKIKVNKKKKRIQITELQGADSIINKEIKKATKGSKGLSYKVNPYYVGNNDPVDIKLKKDGSAKSVTITLWEKKYKAKKGKEWEYDKDTGTVTFSGDNLRGSYQKKE